MNYSDNDDARTGPVPSNEGAGGRPAVPVMPGSTPSTWVGAYVFASVVGLALIRRSFRRFM